MKSLERVLSALALEEPDTVPIGELGYDVTKRIELTGSPELRVFVEKLDLDIVPVELTISTIEHKRTTKMLGKNTWIDGWGIKWQHRNGMDWYAGPGLQDISEIEDLNPPSLDDAVTEPAESLVKYFKGNKALVGLVTGPKLPYLARGIEGYIIDLYRNYDLAKRFMEMNTQYDIEVGKRLIELGVDLIAITGDIAYKGGPLVSMKHFKKVFMPAIKECTNVFHKKGVLVIKHSDGYLQPLLSDLVSTGIESIQSFEPEAGNNIARIKAEYGDKICIWGNIDLSHTLTLGTEKQVEEKTKKLIEIVAPGGGFILSSSNNLNHYCKTENYIALVEAGRKYGKYSSH